MYYGEFSFGNAVPINTSPAGIAQCCDRVPSLSLWLLGQAGWEMFCQTCWIAILVVYSIKYKYILLVLACVYLFCSPRVTGKCGVCLCMSG